MTLQAWSICAPPDVVEAKLETDAPVVRTQLKADAVGAELYVSLVGD